MDRSEMEHLIFRYLVNVATAEELDRLSDWILKEGNKEVFDTYVQLHLDITTSVGKPNKRRIKKLLLQRIQRDKKRKSRLSIAVFTAAILLILSFGWALQSGLILKSPPQPKSGEITITLDNGQIETLGALDTKTVRDSEGNTIGTQKNSKLVYTRTPDSKLLAYNTLSVPYGKQFSLVLSDGTEVTLNSGTSLRYPVAFLPGEKRTVFLSGEAFFEVASDVRHPFIVTTKGMEIAVLGTTFNVSHYPEDDRIKTVLVEGAVSLQIKKGSEVALAPTKLTAGMKGEWLKTENEISVEKVDTSLYTAWTLGRLVFRNTSFKEIRPALERHYNVSITNNNLLLDEQLFDASFDIETIEEVLRSFSKGYAFEYRIENNEIFIQ